MMRSQEKNFFLQKEKTTRLSTYDMKSRVLFDVFVSYMLLVLLAVLPVAGAMGGGLLAAAAAAGFTLVVCFLMLLL